MGRNVMQSSMHTRKFWNLGVSYFLPTFPNIADRLASYDVEASVKLTGEPSFCGSGFYVNPTYSSRLRTVASVMAVSVSPCMHSINY